MTASTYTLQGGILNFYQFQGIHTVLSNSGSINGFSTAMTYIPEERLGIIILTNSSLGWKANMDIIARGSVELLMFSGAPQPRGLMLKIKKISNQLWNMSLCGGRYVGFGPIVDIFMKETKLYAKFKGPAALLILKAAVFSNQLSESSLLILMWRDLLNMKVFGSGLAKMSGGINFSLWKPM